MVRCLQHISRPPKNHHSHARPPDQRRINAMQQTLLHLPTLQRPLNMFRINIQRDIHLFCSRASLPLSRRGRSSCWVHGDGWEHLRGSVGEEHGVHGGAVELVEVETGKFCVGVYIDLPFLCPISIEILGYSMGKSLQPLVLSDCIECMWSVFLICRDRIVVDDRLLRRG